MKAPAPAKPTLTLILPQWGMKLSHLLSPQRWHGARGQTAQWQCAATSSITWQINSHWWRLRGRICCFPSAHWFSNGKSWLMREQGCLLGNNRGRPFIGHRAWEPPEGEWLQGVVNGFHLWVMMRTLSDKPVKSSNCDWGCTVKVFFSDAIVKNASTRQNFSPAGIPPGLNSGIHGQDTESRGWREGTWLTRRAELAEVTCSPFPFPVPTLQSCLSFLHPFLLIKLIH